MFDCKAKFALLFMAGLLIVTHWSQAADYDERNFNDLAKTELSSDDLENEEAHIWQRSLDFNSIQPRRGPTFFRRRSRRRRRVVLSRQ